MSIFGYTKLKKMKVTGHKIIIDIKLKYQI